MEHALSFCPPVDAKFSIGTSEKKPSLSHAGGSARWSKCRGHRPSNKVCPLASIRAARAKSLQRMVVSRSSTLRQEKLAEARTGLSSNLFNLVHAVSREAHSSLLKTRTLKQSKGSKCQQVTNNSAFLDNVPLLTAENINVKEVIDKVIVNSPQRSSDAKDSNGDNTHNEN
eukprot:TRINITY_DN28317_c0_g1_i1.p1 TRINITY_DN28317_c0_g1~~TRINITY_DN28317_c0_g1_i1.p1  ORF type:complete len:171 (+),score=33.88 TRINITY_DN28317_c0_g1_i1:174-686(+)